MRQILFCLVLNSEFLISKCFQLKPGYSKKNFLVKAKIYQNVLNSINTRQLSKNRQGAPGQGKTFDDD